MSTSVLGHSPPLNFPYSQFLFVALAVLELVLWTRLVSNSQRSYCLCPPSTQIKGVCHHCLSRFFSECKASMQEFS